MLFAWITLMWASYGDGDGPRDGEKPGKSSDEQDHREASLKQSIDRSTASSRLPQKRSCILCEKTCCHTYVLQSHDGGLYGL